MGLITETNAQYYAGQQAFTQPTPVVTQVFTWTGNTNLITTTSTSDANFKVFKNGSELTFTSQYTVVDNSVTLVNTGVSVAGDVIEIKLLTEAVWKNYGSYSYITLNDIVDNFLVSYVGNGKLISNVKRTDVLFHAKRGLQEFSYDTLKVIKSIELDLPPSLSFPIPQDYVNYVNLSWIDDLGVKHIIYPTTLTSNPYNVPIQDGEGNFTQNSFGENNESEQSITNERWKTADDKDLNGNFTRDMYNAGVYNWTWEKVAYGQRYGLEPATSQKNGWFTINEREGKFSFSSNLASKLLIIEYISDGLSTDYDMRVPKMAEQALYMHIAYSILSTRLNIPEYLVQRFKKDRRAALRNAKIRLSNIKLGEISQVMRGKSKWIKH